MKDVEGAPAFVKLSLWGINNRREAWLFVALSLLATLALVFLDKWLLAPLGLLAASAYYYSLSWMDKNDRWS